MSESIEIRTMRNMEWQRVKGSLYAILNTYWGTDNKNYEGMRDLSKEFIKNVEDRGFQE